MSQTEKTYSSKGEKEHYITEFSLLVLTSVFQNPPLLDSKRKKTC